jgi:hypothetical protein
VTFGEQCHTGAASRQKGSLSKCWVENADDGRKSGVGSDDSGFRNTRGVSQLRTDAIEGGRGTAAKESTTCIPQQM